MQTLSSSISRRLAAALCGALAACGSATEPPRGPAAESVTADPAPSEPPAVADRGTAAPAAKEIDPALRAALAGSVRTDAERARDGARHPGETLTFFGLRSDMRVVELWPGRGFYTAILGPYLRDRGLLTVTAFDGDPKNYFVTEAKLTTQRLASSPAFEKVAVQRIRESDLTLGPDGSADLVVTFRNVHNWVADGSAPDVFRAAARVLKPGGVLGVVDHRAARPLSIKEVSDTGYIGESQVIELAVAAGFQLEESSEVNANPRDTKDHPHGVWSLPPDLAGKDVDRDKFVAIGESDRMTLRFRKR